MIKQKVKQLKDINLKTNNEPWTLTQLAEFLTLQKSSPFNEFPENFKSLIARLIQDASQNLKELSRFLKNTLNTPNLEFQTLITQISTRVNYGIENYPIYRWEVLEKDLYFPTEILEKLEIGIKSRLELQEELVELTREMDAEELKSILGKGDKKLKDDKAKEKQILKEIKEVEKLAKKLEKETERDFKKQEKLKKEEEKKRLEDSKKKSQMSIQGFFTTIPKAKEAIVDSLEIEKTEYEKTFLPFHQSKYVEIELKSSQLKNFNLEDFKQDVDILKEYKKKIQKTLDKLLQFKILKFSEDVRPPYFGTWSKRSKVISGRKPFAQDVEMLDYDYDSEAEWEEDEPGEELKSEDDLDDDDELMEVDDEDDNDGWVVPHGYLSDDEGIDEEHANKACKKDNTDLPKRTILEQKVPIIVGIQFDGQPPVSNGHMLASCPIRILGKIKGYNVTGGEEFIDPFKEYALESDEKKSVSRSISRKAVFPLDLVDELSSEVIGTCHSLAKIVDDFKSKHEHVKKTAVEQKIKDMFVKEKRGKDAKIIWHMKSSVQNTPLKEKKSNQQECMLDFSTPVSSPTPASLGAGIELDSGVMDLSK